MKIYIWFIHDKRGRPGTVIVAAKNPSEATTIALKQTCLGEGLFEQLTDMSDIDFEAPGGYMLWR